MIFPPFTRQPIGQLLRREGLYSTDLARIRQQVREGAIQRLEDDPVSLSEDEIVSTGYVIHTLHASLWCLLTTQNFADCVLKAVNLGLNVVVVPGPRRWSYRQGFHPQRLICPRINPFATLRVALVNVLKHTGTLLLVKFRCVGPWQWGAQIPRSGVGCELAARPTPRSQLRCGSILSGRSRRSQGGHDTVQSLRPTASRCWMGCKIHHLPEKNHQASKS